MKKPITDEKFFVTDIPNDAKSRIKLSYFLGIPFDSNCINQYMNLNTLSFDNTINIYLFVHSLSVKKDYHTVITYNDLMANYLPKDTVLNDAVDEALKEVSKNEDKLNKVKNPNATHYEIWNGFEAIDIIKNTLSKDEYIGYLKGNILKYQLRVGKKTTDYECISKDLEKSNDYKNELNEILGTINV